MIGLPGRRGIRLGRLKLRRSRLGVGSKIANSVLIATLKRFHLRMKAVRGTSRMTTRNANVAVWGALRRLNLLLMIVGRFGRIRGGTIRRVRREIVPILTTMAITAVTMTSGATTPTPLCK